MEIPSFPFLIYSTNPGSGNVNLCTWVHINDFPGGPDGKVSAYNVGDLSSIPRSERFPGEGNSNPLQYSCLENPIDAGAWKTAVHGVAKSQTQLNDFTFFLSHKDHKMSR